MKLLLIICALLLSQSGLAYDRFANVKIESQWVAGDVHILYGSGGNIGSLTGPDGILIIDDQFEPLAHKIEKSLAALRQDDVDKVKYVVNTHYHGDHTGGNIYFAKSASILAHENVRARLAKKPVKSGLPVITYQKGIKMFLNGETVHVKHLSAGHTDGDSVVYFEKANVWHLGDLFFESRFPYIDMKSGGTFQGYRNNIEKLLSMIDDSAKIIPGHGKLTDKTSLQSVLHMMDATAKLVKKMKDSGLSEQQVVTAGLGDKWKAWHWRFITEERWIKTLYASL